MKRVTILAAIFVLSFPIAATAQPPVDFEFGLRAGIPASKPLESTITSPPGFSFIQSVEKPGYTVGPTFGVVLYDRVVVQFDALYKPLRIVTQETTPAANFTSTTRGGIWEFPLIFDYRFLKGAVRPFGGGGIVLGQTVFGTVETRGTLINSGAPIHNISGFGNLVRQFPAYVVNTGLDWTILHFAIRPEVRYTHWDQSNGTPRRRQDQVDALIGLSLTRLRR